MKNIFTKTLTLIAFLSLSIGVWGATDIPSSLTFYFNEDNKKDNGSQIDETTYEANKTGKSPKDGDGDFLWSKDVTSDVRSKMVNGNHTSTKGAVARSRSAYAFKKGTYEMTMQFYSEENQSMSTPTIKISTIGNSRTTYTATSDKATVAIVDKDKCKTVDVTFSVDITTAGDYYVVGEFGNNEKIGFDNIYFTYLGGGTTYALTLTDDGKGTAVSNQANNSAISENTEVTITATPNSGYKFVNWTGSSTETSNPFTFTMNAAKSYQANFAQAKQVTITITAGTHGSVDENGGTYNEGTQITVTATPETGYEFAQWDDGNTNNPRTITVDESKLSYTASFRKQTKVCTNTFTLPCGDESLVINSLSEGKAPVVNGTLSGKSAPSTSADYICLLDDNDGKKVFYQGFEISESTSGTITVKHASYENYAPAKITLYRTGGSGDKVTYNDEDYFKCIEYSPDLNYKQNEWVIKTSDNQTFNAGKYLIALQSTNWKGVWVEYVTITASDNVFCTEAPATGYEITKGTHAGGDFTIKADGEDVTEADAGTTITLAVSSTDDCKEFSAWDVYETGSSSNKVTVTNNTFEMPEFDVTVDATFATKTYTISYELGSITSQTISPFDATCGNVWIAPTVNSVYGWRQVAWHKNAIDGEVVTSGGWIPTEATTLYLEWAEDLSTDWNLQGTFFNNWQLIAMSKQPGHSAEDVAYVTQHIDAGSYLFKFYRPNGDYDIGSTITISETTTGFKMCSSEETSATLNARVSGDYIFKLDWSSDFNCPTIDVTFPPFYTVTFNMNGRGSSIDPEYCVPNGTVSKPTDPTADNYTFGGWYDNAACTGTAFDFSTAINANTTLYAKWTFNAPTYYYRGIDNSWGATLMTPSDDHMYAYIKAKGYNSAGNKNQSFKITTANSWDTWYGQANFNWKDGKIEPFNGSDITNMGKWGSGDDAENAYIYNPDDFYILIYYPNTQINTKSTPVICASTSLPGNFYVAGGVPLYFDNSNTNWAEGKQYLRIGRNNHNTAVQMTKVTGTANLYECTVPEYSNYFAFTIANAAGWTNGHTIYQPSDEQPTGDYAITAELEYQRYLLDAPYTLTPTTGSGPDAKNCTYWGVDKQAGMKMQNVAISPYEHGSVAVAYTDIDGSSVSDFTSGSKTVAQTCILTITATGDSHYNLQSLTVNGNSFTSGNTYIVTGVTTIAATFVGEPCTVTYKANGHGTAPDAVTVPYNDKLTAPTEPECEGYTFGGWYKEQACTNAWNFSTDVVTGSMNLYAKWTINQHTLTWNTDGDELTGDYTHGTVNYGTTITAPNTPTKTGYTFAGWSSEVPATMPDNDVTLTATWNIINYTITYHNVEVGEHSNLTSYNIESSFTLSNPNARAGYEFGGWYLDENFQTQITKISTGSHENKDIYAKWTAKQYTITLDKNASDGNNGSVTVTYNSGETSDFSAPTRDNYVIEGFYAENGCTTKVMNADGTLCTGVENYTDASGNWVNTTCTTLYTKWTVDYCSNTLTIQCEDDIIRSGLNVGSEGSTPNGMKVIPDDEVPYEKYPNYTGRGYIDLKGNTGATYYAVHLPAATYSFDIYKTNGGTKKLRLYSKSYGSDGNNISYNGTTYKRIFSDQYSTGDSEGSFTSATVSNKTLQEDDYIVALYSEGWASYDQIVITANSKVFCPEMYTVGFAANPSDKGTVTARIKGGDAITSGDEVPENTVVVFTASNIASGYELVNWTDGSGNELAGAVNSFEQKITSNITVNANIEEEATKYTVTVTPGDHGSITSGAGDYRAGATVTIVTAPAANYKVGSATSEQVDEFTISGNNVSFTMPAEPVAVTIYFVFDAVHALIITPNSDETYTFGNKETDGGDNTKFDISSVSDPTGTFDHNVLKLEYDGMSGKYAGRSISKDAGYTPNAKATGFALWYRTEKSDDGIAFCFQKTDNNQTKWQMQATNGEWRYYYWEDNDASNYAKNANFKIYMNGSDDGHTTKYNSGTYYITEIQATNVTSQDPIVPPVDLTVVVSPNGGGTVTTSPEITTGLVKGTPVTLTANPADNYRFVNWTVGGTVVSTDATYNRIVNATETITANFVRVYTLTINNDSHGTATVSPNQTKFAEGDEITVTSVPNSGYKFKAWLDGNDEEESTDDSYTFTMPASDKTLKVTFEESTQYFDISTAVEGEGSVTMTINDKPTDGLQILEGTQVTLTATPNDDSYGFSEWKEDHNKTNPRTITVTENATYTAVFTQVYTVSVELGAPGKEVIGVGKYPGGAQVTLTAVAATKDSQGKSYDLEYQLKEWTVTADVVDIAAKKSDNPLTFTMPYQNVSLKATFAPVECTNTKTIQCEDLTACLTENDSKLTLKPFDRCHGGGCQVYNDHYTGFHGEGYWDFKNASNMAMYYPVTLEPGTYSFTVWNTTDNVARGCWMYIYTPSETDVVLTYDGQNFKETAKRNVDFYKSNPAYFGEGGTISNIVIPSRQKVFIALYASDQWSAWDQIVITATEHVFCAPLPTTDFVINAGETKEIPVCGVDNLTIYDGGQANNYDDVEVFKQVKYSRTVAALDKWETFAVPYNATSITVQDIPNGDNEEYGINPIYGFNLLTEKPYPGYFYLEELKGEDATLMGRPFATRWEIVNEPMPKQNVAYIVRFPTAQSNGYFANTRINYKYVSNNAGGASVTLTGKKNATIIEEDYPSIEAKPTFYFYANNTLANIQLETSAYILNESGMNFDIVDQPVIPPFHCYIQATQKIKQMYPHLAMRNDGGGTTILMPLTEEDWKSMNAKKVLIDEVIYIVRDGKLYSIMGQLVK